MTKEDSDMNEPNVLIVDDEAKTVELYQRYLRNKYTVNGVTGGEEAVKQLDNHVDVVVLNRRMPGMSGDEVADQIQRMPTNTKIVMTTAIEPDMDLLRVEFDEYISKPVSKDELTTAIEQMVARTELEQQLQEMLRLASKITTLEHKLDVEELEESDEYQQLTKKFASLKEDFELPETDEFYHSATMSKVQGAVEGFE